MDAVVVTCRVYRAGSEAVAHRLNCSAVCGLFPDQDQGLDSCPPALAGRILPTAPPGRSVTDFSKFSLILPRGFPRQRKVLGINLKLVTRL